MKKLFIHANADQEISIPTELLTKLPKRVGILTTIQHLEKITPDLFPEKEVVIGGQILGCNANNAVAIKEKVDAYLYIGSGRFHPLAIKMATEKEVFTLNPFTNEFNQITQDDLKRIEQKKKAGYLKFLTSNNIGLMITTKPGQEGLERAKALEMLEPNKNYYYFIADMITPNAMENFPFIECLVNTGCPRITEDDFQRPIINLQDLIDFITMKD